MDQNVLDERGLTDLMHTSFELAVQETKRWRLAARAAKPLDLTGTQDSDLARVLATDYALFKPPQPDPTTDGIHVVGRKVFLSFEAVDLALQGDPSTFFALLLAGAQRAEAQPETDDSLEFLSFTGAGFTDYLHETLTEPAGQRAQRYHVACRKTRRADSIEQGDKQSDVFHPKVAVDFWALLAAGRLGPLLPTLRDPARSPTPRRWNKITCWR